MRVEAEVDAAWPHLPPLCSVVTRCGEGKGVVRAHLFSPFYMLHRTALFRAPLRTAPLARHFSSQSLPRQHPLPSPIARMPATAETASYRMNHTMLRIKDPEKSLKFYQEALGMDLIDEHDAGDFKLFFLGYGHQKTGRAEREGLIELTWNKGTEKKPDFAYHNGNDEPQGFGHLCVSCDDLQACCDRLTKLGVEFKKRPEDGKMRHIAFVYDPDRYWM